MFVRLLTSILLSCAHTAAALSVCASRPPLQVVRQQHSHVRLCAAEDEEEPKAPDGDWRELRARLVAQEKAQQVEGGDASSAEGDGYVYESPLIEQGSVILGGTKQDFGFALRQQYFHKCVMLLLQHDEGFTKGIILNRPSAYELDGWRVWFGGDVAEGGWFRGKKEAKGEREIICLHALDSTAASRLSMPIIKGVAYTSLEGAKALVEAGEAAQSDFWVFVGYAGWAPDQLQGEVERDSWFLASADSGTLLQKLLQQGTELPPPSTGALPPGDGLATWESLMGKIGKTEEVELSRGSLADRMLAEWCRVRLLPPVVAAAAEEEEEEAAEAIAESIAIGDGPVDPTFERQSSTGESSRIINGNGQAPVKTGTVLCAGVTASGPASRFLLSDQFMHKSLIMTVHELPDGTSVAAVLNRPTANLVQFHTDGQPRRCISFGGDGRLRGQGLDIDSNGLMWLVQTASLTQCPELFGTPMGESGLRRVGAMDAAESVKEGHTTLDDYLLLSGLVCFEADELAKMLASGELDVVPDPKPLWPQVWALTDARNVEDEVYEKGGALLSDGTGVWYAATQLAKADAGGVATPATSGAAPPPTDAGQPAPATDGIEALLAGLQAMPPAQIADEALSEWLQFFAGHKPRAAE